MPSGFARGFPRRRRPRRRAGPSIAAGRHTLIAAPTGSGKTLAAFLACIDRLLVQSLAGPLEDEVRVVYVSPLRALSNDMHRNLEVPLFEINEQAQAMGFGPLHNPRGAANRRHACVAAGGPRPAAAASVGHDARIAVPDAHGRQQPGDAPQCRHSDRRRNPRHGGQQARLAPGPDARTVRDLCGGAVQRIGLSATQKPIERTASFLVGRNPARPRRPTPARSSTSGTRGTAICKSSCRGPSWVSSALTSSGTRSTNA